jgi:hypothetical protein
MPGKTFSVLSVTATDDVWPLTSSVRIRRDARNNGSSGLWKFYRVSRVAEWGAADANLSMIAVRRRSGSGKVG